MLKKILIVVVVLIVVLLIVIAMRPDSFKVTRSATIAAPPVVLYEQVTDFHKWEAWSPWAKLDPNAKNSFEGPTSGVGSKFSWDGNNEVGAGSMVISEVRTNEYVKIQLEFIKPFKGSSIAEFTFTPDATQTNQTWVSWSMSGQNNFMSKAMGLFMDCDRMMGGYFEKGLEQLKTVAETPAKSQP